MEVRFHINLSPGEYRKYYAGTASTVQVTSDTGQQVRFPASALKPFVTHQGIHGYFVIRFDGNNKLVDIRQIN